MKEKEKEVLKIDIEFLRKEIDLLLDAKLDRKPSTYQVVDGSLIIQNDDEVEHIISIASSISKRLNSMERLLIRLDN